MDEKLTPNTTEYKKAFNKQRYDQFLVYIPKGEKEVIKKAAEAAGLSVNKFIYEAIREKLERSLSGAEEQRCKDVL